MKEDPRLTRLRYAIGRELYELKVFGRPSERRYELILRRMQEALDASEREEPKAPVKPGSVGCLCFFTDTGVLVRCGAHTESKGATPTRARIRGVSSKQRKPTGTKGKRAPRSGD